MMDKQGNPLSVVSEQSRLLQQHSSASSAREEGEGTGHFYGESLDESEMRKTTHNDPGLQDMVRDVHRLHGSTRILRNSIIFHSQDRLSTSVRQAVVEAQLEGRGSGAQPRISMLYQQQSKKAVLFLDKVQRSFFDDARRLTEGTIPQSIVLAIFIGVVCGIACWLYYGILFFLLHFLWDTLPTQLFLKENNWINLDIQYYWIWIPIVTLTMAVFVGLAVVYLGEPGDLPYTISRVHHHAYIPMDHVTPMVVASLFSVVAGGSLGPEAPLVAICGALGGFVSRRIFRQRYVNVVRKHTLMGMASALSAFFGCPLGGSLFALEVNSRFGIEYFEHLAESIFCGEICLVVFRSLSGAPIAPIWDFSELDGRIKETKPWFVLAGGIIGLLGALVATGFAVFHGTNMEFFSKLGLLDNNWAVRRALLGGAFVVALGLLIPQTMFWGEEEIEVIANLRPASELPFVWPTTGYTGLETDTTYKAVLVGIGKLFAVSYTVASGLRGGYIFPLMCSGAAFGPLIYQITGGAIPLQICCLCMSAGVNVAITRTALASTLILSGLSGEQCALPSILMASLCSLFATAYLPFIKTQITRSDIDHSRYHESHIIKDEYSVFADDDD